MLSVSPRMSAVYTACLKCISNVSHTYELLQAKGMAIAKSLPPPFSHMLSDILKAITVVHAALFMALCSSILLYLTTSIVNKILKVGARRRYATIAKEHRRRQRESIETFKRIQPFDNESLKAEILEASVSKIAEMTSTGKWLVVDVVTVYCHKASEIHEQLNCLTEVFFTEAIKLAGTLDALPLSDRKNQPLFGVPVSLKDNVNVGGFPSSCGFISWRNRLALRNAAAVDMLISAGAVPFCKTNVPQTMRSFECRNPLWGTTDNPHRVGFIPGGSSGGEAALIAAGGSILGFGNDVAGSLRLPAHCSGVCTLKPSTGRVSSVGISSQYPPSTVLHPVCGPLARNVGDLVPVLDVLYGHPATGEASGACSVVPIHEMTFSKLLEKQKQVHGKNYLRFGIIKRLDSVDATPACLRAVNKAAAALTAAGHVVVPFELPFSMNDVCRFMYGVLAADGGAFDREALQDEPLDEVLEPFHNLMTRPKWLLDFYALCSRAYRDKRPQIILESLRPTNAAGLMELGALRNSLMEKIADAWDISGIDAIIMPPMASPALPHGTFTHTALAASYSFLWNVVDWPAGVIPVTKVDPERDMMPPSMRPGKALDQAANPLQSNRTVEAELAHCYNPERMAGLPVGVQVITPRFCEAQCLFAMQVLEDALKTASNSNQ